MAIPSLLKPPVGGFLGCSLGGFSSSFPEFSNCLAGLLSLLLGSLLSSCGLQNSGLPSSPGSHNVLESGVGPV